MGIEIIPKVSMLGHQSTLIRDNKGIAVKTKMHPLLENYPEFDENPEVKLPEIYEWPNEDGLLYEIYEVEKGYIYEDKAAQISPFEVDHKPVEPAYGYKIQFNKAGKTKKIVISGDTRKSKTLIEESFEADALIHEVFVGLGFDKNRINVNVGDEVYPQTKIGELSKFDKRNIYRLYLSLICFKYSLLS